MGLQSLKRGLKLNRAYTLSNCLATAEKFTGKKYPVTKNSIDEAVEDLRRWQLDAEKTLSSVNGVR
jgi:hypothetical protein